MCEFDYTIGKYHVDQPITAHKIFLMLKKKWAYFSLVLGRIPRGKWLRWDSEEIYKPLGKGMTGCETFENGFHCYVRPEPNTNEPFTQIPVKIKGDVTIANQFGKEIYVGEWIYIPTVEELEQESFDGVGTPAEDKAIEAALAA